MSPAKACSRAARRLIRAAAVAAALGTSAAMVGGCNNSQRNEWYFATASMPRARIDPTDSTKVDVDKVDLKFYRVTVTGWSMNSTTELLSGIYPAKPLHELFGEVNRPKSFPNPTTTQPSGEAPGSGGEAGTATGATDHARAEHRPDVVNCQQEFGRLQLIPPNSRFTIFYGANAEAMADQVTQFADAEETGALMGRLLLAASGAGEKQAAAKSAQDEAARLDTVLVDVATSLEEQAKTIDTSDDQGKRTTAARKAMATVAQSILKALNSDTKIDPASADWSTAAKNASKALRPKEETK
jgi:hypothetical protein